jgi:hypothetical protein
MKKPKQHFSLDPEIFAKELFEEMFPTPPPKVIECPTCHKQDLEIYFSDLNGIFQCFDCNEAWIMSMPDIPEELM